MYHTHDTESFTPLLNVNDPNKAFDNKKNITLVGNRLATIA
ncbi:stage II sporulation protein P [Metabacillus sp. Hm71]